MNDNVNENDNKDFPEIGYLDRQEYLNMLRNVIINDILYLQIRCVFPDLLPEKSSFTDKELENIFSHIRDKADSSFLCKRLVEKIEKYNTYINRFDILVRQHNNYYLKNRSNRENSKLVRIEETGKTDLVLYTKKVLEQVNKNTAYVKSNSSVGKYKN